MVIISGVYHCAAPDGDIISKHSWKLHTYLLKAALRLKSLTSPEIGVPCSLRLDDSNNEPSVTLEFGPKLPLDRGGLPFTVQGELSRDADDPKLLFG